MTTIQKPEATEEELIQAVDDHVKNITFVDKRLSTDISWDLLSAVFRCGYLSVFQHCLGLGIFDVNKQFMFADRRGGRPLPEYPLVAAAHTGNLPLVKWLTENGANLNLRGHDELPIAFSVVPNFKPHAFENHDSCYEALAPIIDYLKSAGMRFNELGPRGNGMVAHFMARMAGYHVPMMAAVRLKLFPSRSSMFSVLKKIITGRTTDLESIDWLIGKLAGDPEGRKMMLEERALDGRSTLHCVVTHQGYAAITTLVEMGLDPEEKALNGKSAIAMAKPKNKPLLRALVARRQVSNVARDYRAKAPA